jgi:hypothetical protein
VAVVGVAALVVVGATVMAVLRLAALREEAVWRPPPASGAAAPPPLGGPAPEGVPAGPWRVTALMSLDSVARAAGVAVERLIDGLHLPADAPRTVPLGPLMREHRFTLRDVTRVVEDRRELER